jgi:predicted membrane-bound spermidine synthase
MILAVAPRAVRSGRILVAVMGAASLAGQVSWSRIAATAVGGTLAAAAITLAGAMAGLAAGGLLAAAALRRRGPRAVTAGAVVAGAASLAAMPWLLLQAGRLEGAPELRWTLTAALLAVAHVPFGAVLPSLVAWRSARSEPVDSSGGELYALGALGAMAGGLGLSEVLAPRLALDHIGILLAAGVLLSGTLLFRAPGGERLLSAEGAGGSVPLAPALVAFGLGLLGLGAEFLWLGVLGFAWEANTLTFARVTAATLAGLAAGSLAASRLSRSWKKGRGAVAAGMGVTALGLAGVAALAPFAAGAETAGERLAAALLLVGVPAALSGATFVLLLGWVRGEGGAGRSVALLCAANSAGAAAAPLLLWVAAPWIAWPLRALVLVACGTAALAAAVAPRLRGAALALGAGLGLAGWTLCPQAPSAGDFLPGAAPSDFDATVIPYVRTGLGSTVAVTRDSRTGVDILWIDRGMQGDTSPLGRRIPRTLGRLPVELLGRAPERAAVIGLGTGLTLLGLVEGGAPSVEVAELSAGVIEAGRTVLAEANGRVLERGGVRVRHEDGRPMLADAPAPFDLIVCDMVFPTAPGAGNLFSREFYALARRRLTPDGLFVHWLPCFLLSPEDLSAVCAAFLDSFPEGSAWIGFFGPRRLILGLAGGAIGAPGRERLALGPAELRRLAGGAAPIRDADPRLEVRSREVPPDGSFGRENLRRLLEGGCSRAWRLFAEAAVAELAGDGERALGLYREAAAAGPGATDAEFFLESLAYEKRLEEARRAAGRGDREGAISILRRAAAHPLHGAGHLHLADALAATGRLGEVREELEKAVSKSPRSADAHLKLALVACTTGDAGRARLAFEAACALRPDRPAVYREVARFLR